MATGVCRHSWGQGARPGHGRAGQGQGRACRRSWGQAGTPKRSRSTMASMSGMPSSASLHTRTMPSATCARRRAQPGSLPYTLTLCPIGLHVAHAQQRRRTSRWCPAPLAHGAAAPLMMGTGRAVARLRQHALQAHHKHSCLRTGLGARDEQAAGPLAAAGHGPCSLGRCRADMGAPHGRSSHSCMSPMCALCLTQQARCSVSCCREARERACARTFMMGMR